jgi:DNA methyltransferase 1-associated protein 1
VADILGGAKPATQSNLPKHKTTAVRSLSADTSKDNGKSKPVGKGLSREVFALTGSSPVPISPQKAQSPFSFFRDKRKGLNKHVQWERKSFTNCARKDGLQLKHWQKKGLEWDEYPFARFDKRIQLLMYTDEEYKKLLETSNWTRSESDTLMDLIQRFGMNFFLVHDRWVYSDKRSG